MPEKSRLMPISYYNPKQAIRLSAYADTIILEPDGQKQHLRAIRFGGYPEMVRAMSDAIYAGATLETEFAGEPAMLVCEPKKYERHLSHDGIYAEATILSLDEEDSAQEQAQDGQTAAELPPRKCILFCPAGDRQALFEALDRKTSVPLIPEFQDYVLDELRRRRWLKPLRVISIRERLEAWLLLCKKDDANIVKVLEDGLKSGAIRIPGTVQNPNGFDRVHSVTSYLSAFGVTVAERIRNQFQPLFDPAAEQLSPEILRINDYICARAGYSLYPAQLAVAESVKRKLSKGKSAFIVAECGSGKTKIGATALAAYQAQKRKKTFNIVLCPSHVAKKWVRELGETLPDTAGVIVRSITELDSLYAQYRQGDKSIYAVISKEKARDGYMRRPAVLFDARKGAFRCPGCGEIIELPSGDDTDGWTAAKPEAFRAENRRNHQCMNCESPLWAAVNPSVPSPWVKIPEYGWVHRKLAVHAMQKTKNPAALDALLSLHENPDGYFPTRGACRRYPLSSYIKKRYRGKIDGLIVDELHEYNNSSGQGDAMAELFGTAKKIIGMTATFINGYSSGIFHLLYRTSAQLMLADGKPHEKPALFNTEYGVVETTYTEADESYAAKRRSQKSGVRTRQLPGVSPLVFSRFLLEKTAFLSLSDMGKALPSYEEIPIACRMDEAVQSEYKRIENALVRVLRSDRRAAQKILSAYLNLLTVYPDQPYDQKPILYPDSDVPIVEPENIGDADTLGEKEQRTLEIVRAAIQNGERALIYTSWVRTDSQQKLKKLLTDEGYRTEILTDKIKTTDREDWVQKKLAAGMQVLIVNPSLVETGLDLNAFTTLVFYSMGYKLFTLRQASRRSWRINQKAPAVKVYMLYYKDTMQQKCLKLMASKLAVAGLIEGNFSEEGLAAMSDVQDMTSQMAKELMLGIRDNVEDIAAAFKKMAFENPDREAPEVPAEEAELPSPTMIEQPKRVFTAEQEEKLQAAMVQIEQQKAKRTKKTQQVENQLSLFDFVA